MHFRINVYGRMVFSFFLFSPLGNWIRIHENTAQIHLTSYWSVHNMQIDLELLQGSRFRFPPELTCRHQASVLDTILQAILSIPMVVFLVGLRYVSKWTLVGKDELDEQAHLSVNWVTLLIPAINYLIVFEMNTPGFDTDWSQTFFFRILC
jgi:hypothetical protein